MNQELQRYYESRISMMGDRAWKDLIEDVEKMIAATNDINAIQDEKTLHFRRGELSIMRWLVSLEQTSRDAYEDLKNETSA